MSQPPAEADPAQPVDRRTELIRTAQDHWASALTDLGGRNTLLYFKDRRSGTLDLAEADPEALEHFMARDRSGSPGCSATWTCAPTRSAGFR